MIPAGESNLDYNLPHSWAAAPQHCSLLLFIAALKHTEEMKKLSDIS